MILDTQPKQPSEVLDYDVDYVDWLIAPDTIASHVAFSDAGITIQNSSQLGSAVKVWLAGGTHGAQYKVTVRITTTVGRQKESEFIVKVKET